jgi:hypothetical protein|nr:MAG TPA: hypothetical protein [Caudoviricetes sp.]
MSKPQDKKRKQLKLARLEIVAQLYKRGYSIRKIQSEVVNRLELKTYSIATVHSDIKTLLEEWRENRIEDMDEALQLELERIDDTVRELWEQWEKSKTDYTKTARKQKGSPARDNQTGQTAIRTYQTERTETEVIRLGDPSYISEIRQQLAERRKLLGLYAPEKKDLTGNVSFASYLIESGLIDEAEQQGNE